MFKKTNEKLCLEKTMFIWDKIFKTGPSKFFGRQSLKNLKGYGLLKHKSMVCFCFFLTCLIYIQSIFYIKK